MIMGRFQKRLYTLAIGMLLCSVHDATAAFSSSDTLDLDVTFTGVRDVSLRDAHKQMIWPRPADLNLDKPAFEYSLMPVRMNVNPTWEREKPKRLKLEEPMQRLYRGFVDLGMGNYLSPSLTASYTDLRAKDSNWGTQILHQSTRGGFILDESLENESPQQFSSTEVSGWYKKFFKRHQLTTTTAYNRDHISYYGRTNEVLVDTSFFGTGDSSTFQSWNSEVRFGQLNNDADLKIEATAKYQLFWNDRNVKEHNLDATVSIQRNVESTPFSLLLHSNIDRLKRQEEGLILAPQKQAIFDLHPNISKSTENLKTHFGFGLWIDAQGNKPFLFVPEISASLSLLQNVFVAYGELGGGIDQNRFAAALELNPFIPSPADTTSDWQNTYENLAVRGGLKGSITRAIAFDLSASNKNRKQHLFWTPIDPFGNGSAFSPLYQDVNITTLSGNATWKLNDATSISSSIQQHTYRFADTLQTEMTAWNLPSMEIRGQVRHSIKDKIHFNSSIEWVTGRRGMNAYSPIVESIEEITEITSQSILGYAYDLQDILRWNMRIEYAYNARISAWISGINLLNRTNPVFYGYNDQGIRFQMGFNYAF